MATTNTTADTNNSTPPKSTTIGPPTNSWQHSPLTGFDLTHPSPASSSPTTENSPRLTLQTSTQPITLSPPKTALLIIDMQNFFLSPSFGRDPAGPGHIAMKNLVETAIPAARRAGVRVVWVNWGLTEAEVGGMPPAVLRAFGAGGGDGKKDGSVYVGLGGDCGIREDVYGGEGREVQAGGMLMRDAWNSGLYGPLVGVWEEGRKLGEGREDVWVHKNRMSALWSDRSALGDFLEKEGITSLLLSGVNTDQCVGGTLQDAFSKGYDCVLLADAAGTSSPGFAQQGIEYNAQKSWGFLTSCAEFAKGVGNMVGEE